MEGAHSKYAETFMRSTEEYEEEKYVVAIIYRKYYKWNHHMKAIAMGAYKQGTSTTY